MATNKGIRVDIADLTDLPQLNTDEYLLDTVLTHVIEQTINAMREGGTITVRGETESREQSVQLHFIFQEIAHDPFPTYENHWWEMAVYLLEVQGRRATMHRSPEGGLTLTFLFPTAGPPGGSTGTPTR